MSAWVAAAVVVGGFTFLCIAIAVIVDYIIEQVEKNL